MIGNAHVSGPGGAGSPPASGGAGGAVTCATCGDCSFSASSYLMVSKFIPSCGPGLILTQQDQNWPWFSASGSAVRWQLDASNWAEYSCTGKSWSFSASSIDTSMLGCVQNTTPGYIFYNASPCQGFEYRKKTSGAGPDTTFLIATLVNNVCIPSVPA